MFLHYLWTYNCQLGGCYWWKFTNYRSCVWKLTYGLLQIGITSEKWQWHQNLPTRCCRQCFNVAVFFLSSLVTGSNFRSLSSLVLESWYFLFIKDLTRNLEIENTLVWFLSNTWWLGWVRDIKFDMNICNENILNVAKFQVYRFYFFGIIKGKPSGVINIPPPKTTVMLSWNLLSGLIQICSIWWWCLFFLF